MNITDKQTITKSLETDVHFINRIKLLKLYRKQHKIESILLLPRTIIFSVINVFLDLSKSYTHIHYYIKWN